MSKKAEFKLTDNVIKALNILSKTTWDKPMRVSDFAFEMWPDSLMHSKRSNQGNGACVGKAAWLAAGRYLSKLEKQGLLYKEYMPCVRYYISPKGKNALLMA